MTRAASWRLGLLALIWGSSFLLIVYALEGLSPAQVVLGRLVTGAVVLLGAVLLTGADLPREPVLWLHLAVMGVCANVIPYWLFAFAGERISSGLAAILNATTPLFTLLVAAAAIRLGWRGERLTSHRLAGVALGMAGVVVIVAPWAPGLLAGSLAGQAAALTASACYGATFVYTQRFLSPSGYSPLVLSAGQLLCGSAVLAVLAPLVARTPVALTPRVLVAVLVLGALQTGVAYLLYYGLVAAAGATSASMVTYLLPVVAVVLGVVVLGEPLRWNAVIGAAVVLAGVALAEGRLRAGAGRALPSDAEPTGSRIR